jgi:chromosome segregation ATPase
MAVVTEEARATAAAVTESGLRIGALEEHTRRTDARLTDLVEAKLAELATERIAELDEFRSQLRTALDAHLTETRADVTSAVDELREELAAGAARLDRREAAMTEAMESAADELRRHVAAGEARLVEREAALFEAEERMSQSIEAKLVELDGVAERLLKTQDEVAASVGVAERRANHALEQVQTGLKILGEQFDTVATATARAAFAEEGALAPVRSDVRLLRTQLAELAEAVAELRPRPKTPLPTKSEERARALAAKRAAVAAMTPVVAPAPPTATSARPVKAAKTTKATNATNATKGAKGAKAKKAVPRRPPAQ